MIVPGGTPSVMPLSVWVCAGNPATNARGDVPVPGMTETTVVQGLEPGLGGCAQPAIGAPMRSVSRRTGAPPAVTVVCFGVSITRPPCAQRIVAFVVTKSGIAKPPRLQQKKRLAKRVDSS